MANYKIESFPKIRLATHDIGQVSKRKHYVTALIEIDVSESRQKIKNHNQNGNNKISFTAWLLSVVGATLKKYEEAASFLFRAKNRIIFDDINISLIVEKELNGRLVPVPLVVEKTQSKTAELITAEIAAARKTELSEKDIVLQKKNNRLENLYYALPGFARRIVWKYLLKKPKLAYAKMGNVSFTALGMIAKIDGWFVPATVHPVCFGVSSIIKKPAVINNKIEIREILKMTILLDHDVIDGAPMARFVSELSRNIEKGLNLD